MKRNSSTLLLLLLVTAFVQRAVAQEVWSLQRCIGYAQEKNLTIKQAQASVKIAQLGENQAKASRLPSINANVSLGQQLGYTVDPTTNSFVNSGISSNSLGLNASIPLYTGGQINHSIKKAKYDAQASEADLAQTTNNLALQVAQAYLTILLNTEQLANAKAQLELSKKQLVNTQKLIDAGNLPAGDKYNVIAQIAREEQTMITTDNNLELSYLNIKQLMQLEPDFPLAIERPAVDLKALENYDAYSLVQVYETAKNTQPNILANEFRIKSAGEDIEIARAAYLPSVSAYANLNSYYSTAAKTFERTGKTVLSGADSIRVYDSNNTFSGTLYVQQFLPEGQLKNITYFNQLNRNFGQGFGVSLSIPIYQNGRTKLSVERAHLSVLNAELQSNQTQQQLKNDIQTSLANVRAAKKQLEASQKTNEAAALAFQNSEKRYALGAINTIELNTAKNSADIAENNLTVSRYDYLFRIKILEFYLGKPLLMN
jgi:outer membrane protein